MENERFTTDPDLDPVQQTIALGVVDDEPVETPLKVSRRWLYILVAILLLFISTVGSIVYQLHTSTKKQTKAQTVKTQNIDLGAISPKASPFAPNSQNRVVVNGQLQANQAILLTPTDQPQTSAPGLIYLDKSSTDIRYFNGTTYLTLASTTNLQDLQAALNLVKSSSVVSSLQGLSGALTFTGSGGLAITASGQQIGLNLPQGLTTTSSPTFDDLILSGGLSANSLQQTAGGQNISINAGNDQVTFTANGRTFILPNIGGTTQTICTDQALCLLGGGTALLLGPSSAQADNSTNPSIFINKQNAGNLLELQQGNTDRFVVDNSGNTTIGGTLNVNNIISSGTLNVGTTGQSVNLQGTDSSTIIAQDGSGHRVTIDYQASGAVNNDVTYYFDRSGPAGSYAICTTSGNCTSGNGGVTAPNPGTINQIAKFVGGQVIGDSSLSDNGTVVSASGSLNVAGVLGVNTITPSAALSIGSAGQVYTLVGAGGSGITAGSGGNITSVSFAAPSGNHTITIPANGGTIAVAGNGPISIDSTGVIQLGTVGPGNGGTGLSATPTNGQIPIGNGSGFTLSTLTAGSGINIDNSVAGHITISSGTCPTCANTTLSNLASDGSLAINTSLQPAGWGASVDVGTAAQPFRYFYLFGDSSTGGASVKLTAAPTGNRTIKFPDANGTVAVSATGNIALNTTSGNISFTGLLPVASGGTGVGSLTSGGVLYGNGAGNVQATAAGNNGDCLIVSAGVPTFGSCVGSTVTLQGVYNNSNPASIVLNSTNGGLTVKDAPVSLGAAAALLDVTNNAGSTHFFKVTPSGVSITGTTNSSGQLTVQGGGLAVTGNSTIAGTLGSLTGLTSGGTVTFSALTNNGPVYTTAGGVLNSETNLPVNQGGTGGTAAPTAGGVSYGTGSAYAFSSAGLSGQVLSSGGSGAPSFVNLASLLDASAPNSNITIANGAGNVATITTVANPTFATSVTTPLLQSASSTNLGVTAGSGGVLTLGAAGNQFALTGNSSSTIVASNGGGNTTTVGFETISGATTLNFPSLGSGIVGTVCVKYNGGASSNCTGAGSGDTGSGTGGTLAIFTGSGSSTTLGNSHITENGSTSTTITNSLFLQGSTPLTLGVSGTGGVNGAIVFDNNGTGNSNQVVLQSGVTSTGYTLTLPTANGSGCLTNDGSGVLSFQTCLSGSGGGSGGVISLDGDSGTLLLNNSSAADATHITIDNASTSAKGIASFNSANFTASGGAINTIQGIALTSTPTFAALSLGAPSGSSSPPAATGLLTFYNLSGTGNTTITPVSTNSPITINLPAHSGTVLDDFDSTLKLTGGQLGINGPVGVGNGGTGVSSLTTNGVLYGNGVSSVGVTAAGTNGQCLIVSGGLPTFGSCVGAATTLQAVYNNSPNGNIVLNSSVGPVAIQDASSPLGTDLFDVTSNGGGTKYLSVNASGLTVNGITTSSGQLTVQSGGLAVTGTSTINGDLTFSSGNTLKINKIAQTAGGNNITVNAGSDGITFTALGINYTFQTGDNSPNQTICTSGVSCATGGGVAVLLGPATVQADASTNPMIFLNKTGASGNLLELKQAGTDKFAVDFSGNTTLASGATLKTNSIAQTGSGNPITISAGTDGITFAALGINYTFSVGDGSTSQTICTSGVSCVAGGGVAVLLGPGAVQGDATTNPSIFLNKTASSGNLLTLEKNGTPITTISNTGAALFQNSTDSPLAFQIQNALGTSNLFVADTTHSRIGIGTASPGNLFSVNNLTTADSLAQMAIGTGNVNNKGLIIQGVAGQSAAANLLELQNSSGGVLASINGTGTTLTLKGNNSNAATFTNTSGNPLTISQANGITLNAGNGFIASGNTYAFDNADLSRTLLSLTTSPSAGSPYVSLGDLGTNNLLDSVQVAIKAASNQSHDILDLQDSSGNVLSGFNSIGNLFLGRASAANGVIQLFSLANGNSIALTTANSSTSTFTITVPGETGTLCTTAGSAACTAVYASASGANGNYIQNTTSPQTANFNITGNGTIGTNATVGGSLILTGGTSFPLSPVAGQVYYRTDTKQLYVYENGQWQADRSTATLIVAASNSQNKEKADYVGNGTSDQNAINAAINALPSTGGSVVLLDGTYNITSSVIINKPNVNLTGSGANTILKRMYDESGVNTGGVITVVAASTAVTNVDVSQLSINGNKASFSSANDYGIFVSSGGCGIQANNEKINNNWIGNTAGNGVYIYNGACAAIQNDQITNNIITGSGGNGIATDDSTSNAVISGNVSSNNSGYGIYVSGGTGENITGNTTNSNATGGIITGTTSTNVSDNIIKSNTTYGIYIGGFVGGQNTISGNVIDSNGIGVNFGPGNTNETLSGNTIVNSATTGVFVDGGTPSTNIIISANTISGNGGSGVQFNTNIVNSTITDNTLNNNGGVGSSSSISICPGGPGCASDQITNNNISDSAGTGNAISISSGSKNIYLSNNTYSGTGASSIFDSGIGTVYNDQLDSNGNAVIRTQAGIGLNVTAPTYSIQGTGALVLGGLATPAAPTVAAQGTTGATTWGYKITAYDGLGETLASTETTISNGNANLSVSNFNLITPTRINGAVSYKIYRTTAGGTPNTTGLIGTITGGASTFSLSDTGLGIIGGILTPPTSNTTGQLQALGSSVLFKNSTDSTTAFQIQNAAGTSNLFIADTTHSQVGIGATPANGLLTVGTNTTTSSGGIFFGTDTDLFRAGAGQLATDSEIITTGASATSAHLTVGALGSVGQVDVVSSAAGVLQTTSFVGTAAIFKGGTGSPTVVIKDIASQTGDLLQLQDTSGNVISSINSAGSTFKLAKTTGKTYQPVITNDVTNGNFDLDYNGQQGTVDTTVGGNIFRMSGGGFAFFSHPAGTSTLDQRVTIAPRGGGFGVNTYSVLRNVNSDGQPNLVLQAFDDSGTNQMLRFQNYTFGVGKFSNAVTSSPGTLTVYNSAINIPSQINREIASQTADQMQLQDSGGNVQSGFNSNGQLYLGRAGALTGQATFNNSGGSGSITLQGAATNNVDVYNLPAAATGTYDICTTANNCLGGPSGGANTLLSNLAVTTAINNNLLPGANGTINLGSASVGYSQLFFGTTGSSGSTKLQATNPGSNSIVYNLPTNASGSYDLCTSSGNCLGGSGGGANTALSNLATTTSINSNLLPSAAGGVNLGSSAFPFGQLYLSGTSGTPGTNNFLITGVVSGGPKTITLPNQSGTVVVNATSPLSVDGNGNVSLASAIPVNLGGTGLTTTAGSLTNGQLLIGNSSTGGYSIGNLTSLDTSVHINQGNGTIDLSVTGIGSCTGCADQALDNLSATTAINHTLQTGVSPVDLGTASHPFGNLFLVGTGSNAAELVTSSSTSGQSFILPDHTGANNICIQQVLCTGYAPSSGSSNYLAKNAADSSAASIVGGPTSGNLYAFSNTNSGAAGVLSLTNAGTNSALSILQNGSNPSSGQALILANTLNGSPAGNLIDLQASGISKFSVSAAGAVLAASTYNTNTFNGNTLTFGSAGTATIASAASQALNLQGNATSTFSTTAGEIDLTPNTGVLNLTSTTVVKDNGPLTLQATTIGTTGVIVKGDTNSTGALQVKNNANTNILNVDTVNSTVGVNGSIILTGTASFPGSPVSGQMYYRTDLNQLFVYENGQWQADRTTATKIVSASNSQDKFAADFVGDGTNDQNAINSAIAALPSTGGSVVLLDGTYNINGTITVNKANVSLTGQGASTILKRTYDESASDTAGVVTITVANDTVSSLEVDGSKATYTNANDYGIFLKRSVACVPAADNARILDDTVISAAGSGIYVSGTGGCPDGNALISGNQVTGSNNGIEINGSNRAQVVSNNTYSNTNRGLFIHDNDTSIIVSNNTSYSNGTAGVDIGASNGVILDGNVFSANGTDGIRSGSTTNLTVSNNLSTGNTGGMGIDIVGSVTSAIISNNRVVNNSSRGISVVSSIGSLSISGNTVDSNAAEGILVSNNPTTMQINSNVVTNNGGSGGSNSIYVSNVSGTDTNTQVVGNTITDTVGTGFAIKIDATVNGAYLSNNVYSGTGATSISDGGTGTIYADQLDANGNIILSGQAGLGLNVVSPSDSVQVAGSLVQNGLATPAAPTVAAQGTTGATTWGYKVTAYDGLGETLASTETQITNGNATLSVTNFNLITPTRVSGAISYKVYRTTAGGTPNTTGLIGTIAGAASTFSLSDTGVAAGAAAPGSNSTGQLQALGSAALFKNSTNSTGAFQIQNATASNVFTVNTTTSGSAVTIQSTATGQTTQVNQAVAGQTASLLQFQDSSGNLLSGFNNNGWLFLGRPAPSGITSGSTGEAVFYNGTLGATGSITVQASSPAASNIVLNLPADTSGSTLCTNAVTGVCATAGTGYVLFAPVSPQGDNTTNSSINISKTGASGNLLTLAKGATTIASIGNTGATLFQNSTNSTTAFQVQNAASGQLLNIDSANSNITLNGLNSGVLEAWASSPNTLPTAVNGQPVVTANGYIYSLGGQGTSGSFSPISNVYYAKLAANGSISAWTNSANPIPQALMFGSGVTAGGYIYLLGGCINNSSPCTAIATVYYTKINADGSTGAWHTTTAMPQALTNETSVVANGYVYVMGGDNGPISNTYYAKLNADGTVGAWQTANSMPAARDNASSVIANGYVYVMGGRNSSGTPQTSIYYAPLNTDGSLGSWVNEATNLLPQALQVASSVVANGYVYVMGGATNSAGTTTVSTVYFAKLNADGTNGPWSTNTSAPLPQSMCCQGVTVANGYVYNIGGWTGSANLSSVNYASTSRIQLGGSIDLVGLGGQTLAGAGGTGGSITAADGTFVGSLSVSGPSTFGQSISVAGSIAASSANISGSVPTASTGSVGTNINNPQGLAVQGRYAYTVNAANAGTAPNSLQVYDISNPAAPVNVGSSGSTGAGSSLNGVAIAGRYVYSVSAGNNKLFVFDVSNPASPVIVNTGGTTTGNSPDDVYVQGRYVFVLNSGANTIQAFDVSNPAAPVSDGTSATGAGPASIFVSGRYAYVLANNHLQAFDVSTLPLTNGSLVNGTGRATGAGAQSIYVQGRYAYVANGTSTGSIQIFDVSNPTSIPAAVGSISTAAGTGPVSVYVQGRYAYITTSGNVLQVIDVSNPANPVSVGTVSIGTNPYSAVVNGRYAFAINDGGTNVLASYDLGGTYSQQLEAGGIQVGTLSVNSNTSLSGDANIQGGLSVGGAALFSNDVSISGKLSIVVASSGTNHGACLSTNTSGAVATIGSCTSNPVSDYAEQYPTASGVGVGDVVAQGSSQVPTYATDANGNVDWTTVKGDISQVVKASTPYSSNLIGVVSDNSSNFSSTGYNIKSEDNPMSVALVGRVPVNVTDENGPIAPGDFLTASATMPGYAMKATQEGFVIGQALSSFSSDTPGQVMVFVRGQHWSGPTIGSTIQNGGNATLADLNVTGDTTLGGDLNVSGATTLTSLTVTGSANLADLMVSGSAIFNGTLSVNGHIISGNSAGGSTTVVAGAAACTTPTVTIVGNDTSGTVTIATGTGCTTDGTLATVTFAKTYGANPRVVLTPSGSDGAKLQYFNGNASTTTFTIDTNTIPTAATTYKYNYFVIQ